MNVQEFRDDHTGRIVGRILQSTTKISTASKGIVRGARQSKNPFYPKHRNIRNSKLPNGEMIMSKMSVYKATFCLGKHHSTISNISSYLQQYILTENHAYQVPGECREFVNFLNLVTNLEPFTKYSSRRKVFYIFW